jgi:diguanylate cyclase (GGDEF)-like protein
MQDRDANSLERDTLRLAVRALGELATGPARSQRELLAELLAELCERLGASGGVVAERTSRAPGAGTQRVLIARGGAALRFAVGDELGGSEPAVALALAELTPACASASDGAPAQLALPLHSRGELLGMLALERTTAPFTADECAALAPFAAACGELLLGYTRAGLRARAEEDLLRSQRHLRRSAALDGLTGLATRAATQHALEDAVARSHAAGMPLALIALDVDDAKAHADRSGAAAFDEALAQASRLIRDALRPTDWSGRWGIDTFLVTLLGCDAEGATLVAERIRLRIEGAPLATSGGNDVALTLSAGVASTGLARELAPALTARVLGALEEAKRAGRNRVCVSRPARA